MGIKGLTKLISDNASHAIRESELRSYNGRRVAIDASMAIYQFLVRRRAAHAPRPTSRSRRRWPCGAPVAEAAPPCSSRTPRAR